MALVQRLFAPDGARVRRGDRVPMIERTVTRAKARGAANRFVNVGAPALDRVVPVAASLQILELIPHATHVMFGGTGHVGSVTRPDAFAEIVDQATVVAKAYPLGRRAS